MRLRAEGKLDQDMAQTADRLFEQMAKKHRKVMAAAAADAQAGDEALGALTRLVADQRRRQLLTVQSQVKLLKNVSDYRNLKGQEDWAEAWDGKIDLIEGVAGDNLFSYHEGIRNLEWSQASAALDKFRPDLLGRTRNTAELREVAQLMWEGRTEAGPAGELAGVLSGMFERLRQRFNRAGGSIAKRIDGYLPVRHDGVRVRAAPRAEWVAYVRDRLDTAKMLDAQTGLPFADGAPLDTLLNDIYDSIAQDGFNKMTPGGAGKASLAAQRAQHRVLEWKSFGDWEAYHEKFGHGDLWDVIAGHADGMARDVAAVELLGPNPAHMIRYMRDAVLARAKERDAAIGKDKYSRAAMKRLHRIDVMWGDFTGANNVPLRGMLATGFATIRAYLPAAQLGSALLSSVTDFNTSRIAAQHVGLPVTRVMARYLSMLNPLDQADRQIAKRSGVVLTGLIQRGASAHRMFGEEMAQNISSRLSDGVMRVSGLALHTDTLRFAFGHEFLGFMAEQSHLGLDALPKELRKMLGHWGLARDWDALRAVSHTVQDGARFLTPADVARAGDDRLATSYAALVSDLTTLAVPNTSARGRAMVLGGVKRGTIYGEILQSVLMYKNFPISLMGAQLRRIQLEQGVGGKALAAVDFAITMTVFGALSVQLGSLATGKDPRDMTGDHATAFWGAAILKGGGLGIFGDFITSVTNRFGGGLGETIAGPPISFIGDTAGLGGAAIKDAVNGKDSRFARDAAAYAKRYTPGTNIWYTRLALERLWWDRLQETADPDVYDKWDALARKAETEYGTDYYWQPGQTAPDRAPQVSNAMGLE
jgi:hypothetical protein